MTPANPPSAPVHAPLPADIAPDGWAALASHPEIRCAEPWAAACGAWWHDDGDRRLRERALGDLVLSADELAGWAGRSLDRPGLIRAHDHVIAMRAGLERSLGGRSLTSGALRTTPVASRNRLGDETAFVRAREVPRRVDELCATYQSLPSHPFLRAAWLVHAISAIHPFQDGNGGTARFMASLELARASLPALTLSIGLRNGEYMAALVDGDQRRSIQRLAMLVADVVQRGVVASLLSDPVRTVPWTPELSARASAWLARVGEAWASALGDGAEIETSTTAASLARLSRRGYRVPVAGEPRYECWRTRGAPVQLDAALVPVQGGPRRWLVGMLAASVGPGGELGALDLDDRSAPVFVAADDEPDSVAGARFSAWAEARLAQYVVGVSRWM